MSIVKRLTNLSMDNDVMTKQPIYIYIYIYILTSSVGIDNSHVADWVLIDENTRSWLYIPMTKLRFDFTPSGCLRQRDA